MSQERRVTDVIYAHKVDMGGQIVRQPLPSQQLEALDPFLLLHHADVSIAAGTHPAKTGVGPHPHRGFSPVTLIFAGAVHHRDSQGNDSIIEAGGTQWMNAGSGIIHSERPPKQLAQDGGQMEIIQLWVNTPKAHKMEAPSYQPLTAAETPTFALVHGKVTAQLVAGQYGEHKGPIQTHTELLALRLELQENARCTIDIPDGYNAFVYLLDGMLEIGGHGVVEGKYFAALGQSGEHIRLRAEIATRAILMAGKPIDEETVSYGPFVMNSHDEIQEAMRDFQQGKMGTLHEDLG